MNINKIFSAILSMLITVSLVGCGNLSNVDPNSRTNVPNSGNIMNSSNNTDDIAAPESESPEQPQDHEATIAETVLLEEAGVKITAKSLETDGIFGPKLKLQIENTSGKDLTFQCRNASVNGYMVESMMSVDVLNDKKANDSITFLNSDLKMCGIDSIADIELSFHIYDSSEWETYLDSPPISLKTSIADTYEYRYDDSGEIAYEENGIKIVIKGLNEEVSILGTSIMVFIENNSDKEITVQAKDISINGLMMDAIFSCDVATGKRAIDTITFLDSNLEENDITAIKNVELSFHIFDANEWETIVDTDVVTMTF